ncbi:MAG: ankyrin repeat domain-containing protein [Alphaproteobacteria bacterium]|nr:ankyrin repeat domain-containing protein [Alphaproteobacteria bacterium]
MTTSFRLSQQQIDSGFAEAVLNGNKEEVAFYADFVSNPNIADKRYGRLPIWTAMEHDDTYEKTKIVLSLKPDVNVRNRNGQTPAMVALEKRMHGVGILFLRHEGLDVAAVDNQGNDLMKYAVLSRSAKVVYEAFKRGIPVDRPDKNGYIPAYWAVKNGDMDVFKALCDCGLIRDKNNLAYQEVMKAASQRAHDDQETDWVQAVYHGVFPERKTYELTQDWNTLFRRIERLSSKNQMRLNKIFGISLQDISGNLYGEETASQMLSRALIEQCRYGNEMDVSLLLSLGADPNQRDKMGRTPLFCAVEYRGCPQDKKTSAEIAQSAYQKVKILLDSGANPNLPNVINCKDKVIADKMPLEHSLYLDRIGISLLLIRAGAVMTTMNSEYPLAKTAAIYSKPEAIEVLAHSGADLMLADTDGVIPIEHALLNNKPYNVAVLRKHLMAQGYEDLFCKGNIKGKQLYEIAQNKDPLLIEALDGELSLLKDTKQISQNNCMGFEEKIEKLSVFKRRQLATMAGVDFSVNDDLKTSCQSLQVLPNRAINRHTVFRQAMAVFKRKQRAKILLERQLSKKDGR